MKNQMGGPLSSSLDVLVSRLNRELNAKLEGRVGDSAQGEVERRLHVQLRNRLSWAVEGRLRDRIFSSVEGSYKS